MQLLPDPDNRAEMWMVIQLLAAIARANEWVFLGVLVLLAGYIIGRIAYAILLYLFHLYRERAFAPSPYTRYFRIALGIGVVVLVVGIALTRTDKTYPEGVLVLSWGFGLFSVMSFILDWLAGRSEQVETPELDGATLDDVVAWQQEVNAAYGTGLMVRSS